MTNKRKAINKFWVWLISIFLSFVPIILTSFISMICGNNFWNTLYLEFCKSSILYISISSISSLVFGYILDVCTNTERQNIKNKGFDIVWCVLSIFFLIITCFLYGTFSLGDIIEKKINTQILIYVDMMFWINLVFSIIVFLSGLIKNISDIVRED